METISNVVIDVLVELFGWIDRIGSYVLDHWSDVEETIKNVLNRIEGAAEKVLGPFQKLWDIITGLQKGVKLPSLPGFSIPGITAGAAPPARLTSTIGGLPSVLGVTATPFVNLTVDVHDNKVTDEFDKEQLARDISNRMIDELRRYMKTMAVMALYNPFFEKAGMKRIAERKPDKRIINAIRTLEDLGFKRYLLTSVEYNLEKLKSLTKKRYIESERNSICWTIQETNEYKQSLSEKRRIRKLD